MSRLVGLRAIKAEEDRLEEARKAAEARREGKKNKWMEKMADGQVWYVQFLQELDEEAENYDPEVGVGFIAVEHVAPHNFRKRAECSISTEGLCKGCEEHRKGRQELGKDYDGGWRQQRKLYINAALWKNEEDVGDVEKAEVVILTQNTGPKSITPALLEAATDDGTIMKRTFKLRRNGSGLSDTSYLLHPKKQTPDFDPKAFELNDLSRATRKVPYVEQAEFYELPEDEPQVAEVAPEIPRAAESLSNVKW
jgi:hypothetical protein